MKKIVSAVALSAMAIGMASAQVGVKLNSRTSMSVYSQTETYAADNATSGTLFDFTTPGSLSDDLVISGKSDVAGVYLKLSAANTKPTYDGTADYKTTTPTLSAKQFYGFIKYGNMNVTAGTFDSRFTNRYNVSAIEGGLSDSATAKWGASTMYTGSTGNKTDAKDTYSQTALSVDKDGKTTKEYFTKDYDAVEKKFKYNSAITKGTVYDGSLDDKILYTKATTKESVAQASATTDFNWLVDFNNISAYKGTDVLGFVADWTFSLNESSRILAKVGVLANEFTDATYRKGGAGYALSVIYQSKPINVELVARYPNHSLFGFGAYFDVKAVKNLTCALGYTMGFNNEKADAHKTMFVIDGRFGYKITDPFSVLLQVKFSGMMNDAKAGSSGIKNVKDETIYAAGDSMKMETALETVLSLQYKVSDLIQTQLDAGLYFYDLDNNYKEELGVNVFKVRPGVKFSASSAAAVTVAFEGQFALNGSDASDDNLAVTRNTWSIPVIMRIKM